MCVFAKMEVPCSPLASQKSPAAWIHLGSPIGTTEAIRTRSHCARQDFRELLKRAPLSVQGHSAGRNGAAGGIALLCVAMEDDIARDMLVRIWQNYNIG